MKQINDSQIIYTDEAMTVENKNTFKENLTEFVNKHAEIWKFIKFTFTGASTSVLELAVFWLLQYVIFKSLNEVPVTDNQVLSFLGIEYKGYMYSYFISAVFGYAAAYVMMAYRIAYCKINYPLAYYAAYFSIRADAFSYEIMCQGREKLDYYMKDYKRRSDTLTKKEQDTMKDMKIVQEMYARGFEFVPVDLYKAKAKMFQIVDGKLMPSFASIEGMGDKAAEAVEEAGKDGPYLSLDDFRQRTKVSKTVIDLMAELGLFGNLPQSNQLSLFDFS